MHICGYKATGEGFLSMGQNAVMDGKLSSGAQRPGTLSIEKINPEINYIRPLLAVRFRFPLLSDSECIWIFISRHSQ